MVQLICDCDERIDIIINSYKDFVELKEFFQLQVDKKVFKDIPVKEPLYVFRDRYSCVKWYADKWYKCNVCGCLWEFEYPDFPAKGRIRKFADGVYYPE